MYVTWAVFLGGRVGADTCCRKLPACKCLLGLHFGVTLPCGCHWAPRSECLTVEGGREGCGKEDKPFGSFVTHSASHQVKGLLHVMSNLPDHWPENAHPTQENAHQTLFSLDMQYNLYFFCCRITLTSLDFISAFAVCRSCSHSRSHWRSGRESSKKEETVGVVC